MVPTVSSTERTATSARHPTGDVAGGADDGNLSVMPDSDGKPITRMLQDWQAGDRQALDRLIPIVYRELHMIASRHMAREAREGSLQTTGLVNEAYMRLVQQRDVDWQNRGHFFAIAAQLMRRILVDQARSGLRDKRGAQFTHIALEHAAEVPEPATLDVIDTLALDSALKELEQIDRMQGRVVELRFFGGLTVEETAEAVGMSPATVKREWAMAKAWLYDRLFPDKP